MSQQNKTTLQAAINTQIADNTTGEISAADVRDNLINMTDSLLFNNGANQTITGSLTVTGDIIGSLQGTVTNAIYATNADYATLAQQASIADYVVLEAGQGISINGLQITADVRTVNGTSPDGNGNIPLSLGTVYTGTSASLVLSSSGAVTGSIPNATVWVVSGDSTPSNNGDTYIYKSGSVGQWLEVAPLDQAAGDARYARINVQSTQQLTSSFSELATQATNADTASYVLNAVSSSFASTASLAPNYVLNSVTSSMSVLSSSYALTASYALNGGGGGAVFPYNGDAVITGSLLVSGGAGITGSLLGIASTASYVDPLFAFNGYKIDASSYIGGVGYSYDFAVTFTDAFTVGDYGYNYYDFQNTAFTYNPSTHLLKLNGGNLRVGVDLYTAYGSTALGSFTSASGLFSLSQGSNNKAIGPYSHAEGFNTQTSGSYSHAEGSTTVASGSYSHAEGYQTTARGDYSHAEGSNSTAVGYASHVEGNYNYAGAAYAHAEGAGNYAYGVGSHAEGSNTIAYNFSSHAEGAYTRSSGSFSHSEGSSSLTLGIASHAEGFLTTASADYSHAEGWNTVASGSYQHTMGQFNQTSSAQSAFIIGNGTSNANRSNLVFASGSKVQVTGSVELSGSIAAGQATIVLPGLLLNSFANDAEAAAGGIPLGGLYRNATFIQIRTDLY